MKRFYRNDNKSIILKFVVSVVAGFVSTLVMLFLFSLLISKNDIPPDAVRYFWFPVIISGSVVSGLISGRIVPIKGIISGIATSAILSISVVILLFLFNGFVISAVAFLLIPVSLISGTVCSIISANFR